MKAVLMAGGRGTRISSIATNVPKPMIKIGGEPILEHEIRCLKEQGITDFIITISHLGETIINYFGDGRKHGVSIRYFHESVPMGTAGALFHLKDELTDDFLLLNADAIFDVDFSRFVAYHKSHRGVITLFTHPNSHPFDSAILVSDETGAVTEWLNKEDKRTGWYKNRVNAGIHLINPRVLDMTGIDKKLVGTEIDGKILTVDLDRQILKPLCGTGKMFCYDSSEYVKDMGTPKRYRIVCRDFEAGIVRSKNLTYKQKAIFLDRDGTINKYVGFLRNIEDFVLLPGAAEAIKRINESGYLAIVVTNQPVIARGEITEHELQEIHNKMETLLGQQGAYVDAIYYCPHHPDKGYAGEIAELKTSCNCRKPKPGMLTRAADDFNIDLGNSWMIGDAEVDIAAGKAAGCRTILLRGRPVEKEMIADSLLSATKIILDM